MEEFQVNTLVTHKKLKTLGIGCVSKILSKSVKVNFGTENVKTCKIDQLEIVDTSKCKTISFQEFKSRIINDKSTLEYVILGNELRHYVGIGWTTSRAITMSDLLKYPRVI